MVYNIKLSYFERDHVVEYIKEQKKLNPLYKVIDIGAPADYTSWSYDIVDYIVDMKDFNHPTIKNFKLNINNELQWQPILQHVKERGKFDFCICSHTLEDIAMPSVVLTNMPIIAKEGFIATPSKYAELSKIGSTPWLGYIHHRWIFTFKNGIYTAFPKLNFIEHAPGLIKLGTKDTSMYDLSFFWKETIEFKIINDDYMGPTTEDVLKYYLDLLNDDLRL